MLSLALSGSLQFYLAPSGSLWLTLAPSGSLWLTLARCPALSGSLWLCLAPSGSLRLSLALRICLQSPCLAHKALAPLERLLLRYSTLISPGICIHMCICIRIFSHIIAVFVICKQTMQNLYFHLSHICVCICILFVFIFKVVVVCVICKQAKRNLYFHLSQICICICIWYVFIFIVVVVCMICKQTKRNLYFHLSQLLLHCRHIIPKCVAPRNSKGASYLQYKYNTFNIEIK